jgi:hypothetical protein
MRQVFVRQRIERRGLPQRARRVRPQQLLRRPTQLFTVPPVADPPLAEPPVVLPPMSFALLLTREGRIKAPCAASPAPIAMPRTAP